VLAARALRRVRPLLQQGHVREGGHHGPAEDVVGTAGGREEAHGAEPGRLDQGRRLRPAAGLLRELRALHGSV
jgi:hypothetical protein